MIFDIEPENFVPSVEAVGCFVEYDGKILLMRRHQDKPYGGTWCVPGGKLDKNEDMIAGIVREAREEADLNINSSSLEYIKKTYLVYPSHHLIYHVFKVVLDTLPVIKLKLDEHTEYLWVTPVTALTMDLIPDEDYCIKQAYQI
jgi:8-oxo-dGTP pyrophosphatase MutT (NUDIX family)